MLNRWHNNRNITAVHFPFTKLINVYHFKVYKLIFVTGKLYSNYFVNNTSMVIL